MNQVLTLSEIQSRYISEWVLVGDPETTRALELLKGKILWHSKNRDEVYQKARELKPKHSAILYTGKMPKNTAIIL